MFWHKSELESLFYRVGGGGGGASPGFYFCVLHLNTNLTHATFVFLSAFILSPLQNIRDPKPKVLLVGADTSASRSPSSIGFAERSW